MQNKMIAYIRDCFKDIIAEYSLSVKVNKSMKRLFTLDLENENDALYICYSTHPHDYPWSFDVRYCKQKFFDKTFVLYKTDTNEIVSLWRFDKQLDTTITGSFEKDMPIISECCKRASDMFIHFQRMSDDEYAIAAKKLKCAL